MSNQSSKNSKVLDIGTQLAFDRTRLAYDRTMMAWVRTATSLISFGFTIYKFFQIEISKGEPDKHLIGPREFGVADDRHRAGLAGDGDDSASAGSECHESHQSRCAPFDGRSAGRLDRNPWCRRLPGGDLSGLIHTHPVFTTLFLIALSAQLFPLSEKV